MNDLASGGHFVIKFSQKFWPLGLLLTVSACGMPPIVSAVSYAIEGASYAASGKSMTDHALSAAADSDCAMFRIVKGEEICRNDAPTEQGTLLAMADTTEPDSTLVRAEERSSQAPVLYSFGPTAKPGPSGWQIANGAGISDAGAEEARENADNLIAPGQIIPAREGSQVGADASDVLNIPAGIELFALVQDDGTLELFAYDNSRSLEKDKLILVASIEGYADNPTIFSGVSRNDQFIDIQDLIV